VRNNVVAWNADGISVISQARDDDEAHVEIHVEDNTILSVDQPSDRTAYALAWVADWPSMLFDPASANGGRGNRYWYPRAEGDTDRFAWQSAFRHLAEFDATPGDQAARYLSDTEATELAHALGLPDPPGLGGLDAVWSVVQVGLGLVALGSLAGWLAVATQRRRAAMIAPITVVLSAASLLILGPSGAIWPTAAFGLAWIAAAIVELAGGIRLRSRHATGASHLPDYPA
jgi:hypothetical protein